MPTSKDVARRIGVSPITADFGGGIDNYWGSMAPDNVTLEDNVAKHYGGGITRRHRDHL